jgi:S-DNA-T family DNA segregation ATPase FtsK/SpoIIIE
MATADRIGSRPFLAPAAPLTAAGDSGAAPRNRVRDMAALVLLAGCVFFTVALATYAPGDPPTSRTFPPHERAVNACGLVGAAAAAALYETLGLGAWSALGMLVVLDIALLRRRPLEDLPLRTAAAAVAIAAACTLLAVFLPDSVPRPLWGPGGRLGGIGHLLADTYLAEAGAAILLTALLGGSLYLAMDTVLIRLGGLAWASAAAAAGGLAAIGSRLRPRWAGLGDESEDEMDLATVFPGLRNRLAGASPTLDDEAEEDEAEEEDEPTIRVRRREPVVEAAEEDEWEEDDDPEAEAEDEDEDEAGDESEESEPPAVPIGTRGPRRRPAAAELELAPEPAGDYELPGLDLLLATEYLELDQQEQEVRERARMLEKTFAEFGFKVKVVEIETGPVISQYEIELEAGLRLAKITNLADDLAIALRVPSVRIVAPIPGKNSVGIEVPNTTRQMVRLREVIEETQSKSRAMKIPIFLGKDVAGNPMVMDMATMPHLLIAGRTGTGKSVCLNSIIVSMLMTRRPDEVRMLMIDPKMVELTPYKSLPHLMHPVVTDMKKAEAILAWAVEKMEQRYTLLAKVGVRHLTQYNALGRDEILRRIKPETEEEAAAIPTTMPFIVMIADEIADMMMTAGKEIEAHIIRLAQKSRAVGIHLVLATQKPTVDVITGLIKSNLPARIAFQVASRTDSRVVLDEMGAERLLGNGDMLFLSPGTSQILRGQGTFVSDDEIGRVMGTIGTSEPQYAAELVNLQPAGSEADTKGAGTGKDKDELYEAAVEVIIREGRGSVSLLQRALGVGYGRGARLIDFMAEDGIVGEYKGSQAREVLLTMEEWAARNGSDPLPPDPPPRKLKIQPHAGEAATPQVEADEDEAGDDWGEEAPEWAEDEGDWDEGDEGAESDEDTDEAADSDDDEEFEEDAEDEEDEAEYESEEDEATDDFGSENDVPAPDAADSPRCR